MPTRDQEEIYGVPQKPENSTAGDDDSSCGSMPALVDRPDDDSSVDTDSSWGSMPGLTTRPDNDDDSWSECSWDIDSQASSQG